MHIKLLPLWISSKFVYTTFAFCVAFFTLILLSPSSFASSELPSTYTAEDLSNFAITVNTFCASNVYMDNNALSYSAYSYSTQEYSTYIDTFNYYTIYNPNNCTYWGVSRIDLDNWAIAPDTYIYTELLVDNMYVGYNKIGQGEYGYINTTSWDMQLHDNSWNTYGLVKDGLLVTGRFHYTISEENGLLYDDTEYNFYSDSANPYLYPRFGSSALVSNNGSWSPQYFGDDNVPIWYNSAGAASMSFSLRMAYSDTVDDWVLESASDGGSGSDSDNPEWDIIQDNVSNAPTDYSISLPILNPISSWLALFTDTQCITVSSIPSWFGLSSQTICSPWGDLRDAISPVVNIFGSMLIFGFAVSWLRGFSTIGSGPDGNDLKYGLK